MTRGRCRAVPTPTGHPPSLSLILCPTPRTRYVSRHCLAVRRGELNTENHAAHARRRELMSWCDTEPPSRGENASQSAPRAARCAWIAAEQQPHEHPQAEQRRPQLCWHGRRAAPVADRLHGAGHPFEIGDLEPYPRRDMKPRRRTRCSSWHCRRRREPTDCSAGVVPLLPDGKTVSQAKPLSRAGSLNSRYETAEPDDPLS